MDEPRIETRGWVFGTFHAVAEAAMAIRRSPALRELRVPDGIQWDAEYGRYCLVFDAVALGGECDALGKRLSQAAGTVVGMSTIACGGAGAPANRCYWGGSTFERGREYGHMTGSLARTLPPDIAAIADNAGSLPADSASLLHLAVLRATRERARAPGVSADEPREGYPRWSLLAHTVNAQGLGGLYLGAQQLAGGKPLHELLIEDLQAARRAKLASWIDTLFYGWRVGGDPSQDPHCKAYSDAEAALLPERHDSLFAFLARADSDVQARALLRALAHSEAAFSDGQPFIEYAASVRLESNEALAGRNRLGCSVDTLAPGNESRNRVAAAPVSSGFAPSSIDFASKVVGSYGFVAGVLANAAASRPESAAQLLASYKAIFGGLDKLPADVEGALKRAPLNVSRPFEALQTEDAMGRAIEAWSTSSRAPAANTVVITKRRRRTV